MQLQLVFVACAAISVLAAPSSAPNMVIVLADDMGWGDMSSPLGVSPAQTPNLVAMSQSANGVHFPRFYSGGPVCSPTRATVLTGRTNTRDCIITVEQTALPLQVSEGTIARYAQRAGYATFFAGKWHLGSMTNSTTSADCYDASRTNNTCLPGYIRQRAPSTLCCDGRDAYLVQRTPLDFGFDTVFATSQVAPSSTSNCGCLETVPGAGFGCNLGHYAGDGHVPPSVPGLECDQTFMTTESGEWVPYKNVTAVDDAEMLFDHLEAFMRQAVAAGKPFLAQVSLHQVHIPYIAPPSFRALYSNYTINQQDYYGALTAADAQIGRLRTLLASLGVAQNTLVAFTADNGPEVDSAHGHGTAPFPNPGLTGGLQGRKRALLEGGIRVAGVMEAPFLVGGRGPLELSHFAAVTNDFLPTFMDLIGATNIRPSWPLDGISLVPVLNGSIPASAARPTPIGWMSVFPLSAGNATCPAGAARLPPSAPADYSVPEKQAQIAWTEGPLTLTACRNELDNFVFRLFNVETDPAEANDLFASNLATADAMFQRMYTWQQSVAQSWNTESMCPDQP